MSRKQLSLGQVAILLLALATFLGFSEIGVQAQSATANFVYVMTNKSPNNSVIQYLRNADGSLTWLREVQTGGNGTGATGVDPLGSQDSLVLSGDGHLLLAANAGSNDVTVFQIQNNTLTSWNKIPSGGSFPNSLASYGDLVYVLNAKGTTPNITGFRLGPDGFLHMIPGAEVNLPSGASGPNDIRFAEDGEKLLVTLSGSNQILVFEVGNIGVANPPSVQSSAGASPFGIRSGRNGVTVVSEAAGSVSTYSFSPADMLDVISGAVSDTQSASCWLSLNRLATYAYISNTGSGTISSYQIDSSGHLTLLNAVAANTGGAPIDSALSRDSRFMYVLDSAMGRVIIFKVNGGNLSQTGMISSLPTSIQGIAAQ